MPPGDGSNNKDSVYLLMVEFNKTMQAAQTGQNQILTEIRAVVSQVSERLARMEAQDLGKRIQLLDDDLRTIRDGEISRLRERLQSMENSPKIDLKPLQDDIQDLKNTRVESRASQRIYIAIAGALGSFLGAAALVVLRAILSGGG